MTTMCGQAGMCRISVGERRPRCVEWFDDWRLVAMC